MRDENVPGGDNEIVGEEETLSNFAPFAPAADAQPSAMRPFLLDNVKQSTCQVQVDTVKAPTLKIAPIKRHEDHLDGRKPASRPSECRSLQRSSAQWPGTCECFPFH